jgi:type IV pilus assembly protein PilC
MPSFKYKAISKSGETLDGVITVANQSDVVQMLREKEYLPVNVEQIRSNQDIDVLSFMKRVKTKDIAIFCRQFHTMLNSGISIIQCLDILRQQFDNLKLRKVIADVYELVQKGSTFSESMRAHRETFPELLINMIEAGELSGNLDTILQRMADHYEKDTRLKRKISGAMVYPLVLSGVATLVVIFLLIFVMPVFVGMFTSSGVQLPLPTRILLGLSDFLRSFWYIVFGILFIGIYLLRRFLKTETGRLVFDRLKLRLPIIKPVAIRIATTRFARTLSTLLASGIPLLNAMEITSKVVREDVRKGFDLAGPVKRTGLFPPMVDSMIRIGEESGSLDDVLKRTADFYDEEVDTAIAKMTAMLEPLMIVLMAVVIGSVIIAIASPMFTMFNTIG